MIMRVQPHQRTAEGMTHQHIGRRDSGIDQQLMEFIHHFFARAWIWAWFAPSQSCAIIRADTRALRDFRLHLRPENGEVIQSRRQYDRWTSLARAIDVHLVTFHAHHLSRGWILF